MMSPTVATILLGSLLVASALVSANQVPVQPENSQHIPSDAAAAAAAHHHHHQQQQHSSSPNVVGVVQPVPPQAPVVGLPEQQQQVGPQQPMVHMAEHQQQQQPAASYYSPAAGVIQVVGEQQQQPIVAGSSQNKPGQVMRNLVAPAEQYGQPESASVPANYKPWGSWGLYIGGNPADGYYTDYYKALGNSVNKQQQQQQQQVVGGTGAPGVNQVSAFSPVLKQAGSSPYVGADYYPFAYSPNELNSGYQQPMAVVHHQPQSPSAGSVMSVGSPSSSSSSSSVSSSIVPQVYSTGAVQPEAPMYAYTNYADNYANTKRFGSALFANSPSGQQAKSYASPKMMATSGTQFAYPNMAPAAAAAPAAAKYPQQQQPQQQQLYAYPVPVGSQIVGSQQGVEGAFMPYGVHAFTRYAVKPTMMNSGESGYYYSAPPAYKQQMASGNQQQQAYSPPMGYYGPAPSGQMAQLHYSSSIDGVFGNQQQQQQPSPMVNGQQVGVIESPVVSSYASHIVHQPAIQFEASASETSATSASATSVDKVPQKNKNNQQDKQQ